MAERQKVAEKVYVLPDGEESNYSSPDATELQIRFENNQVVKLKLSAFPQNVRDALAWHGLAQKVGDSYAGKGDNLDDAFDAAMAVVERLEAGEWMKAREGGGPRISQLLEATMAAFQKAGRTDVTEDQVKEAFKSKDAREKAAKDPRIAAELARVRAEAAQKRYEEATEKAEGSESVSFSI